MTVKTVDVTRGTLGLCMRFECVKILTGAQRVVSSIIFSPGAQNFSEFSGLRILLLSN